MVLGLLLSHHAEVTTEPTVPPESTEPESAEPESIEPESIVPDLPPAELPDRVVRRPRAARVSQESLSSPLLSGRSLQPTVPPDRWAILSEHRSIVIGSLVLVLLVAVVALGKIAADSAADSDTAQQAARISELLQDATPDDFLAFNSGVKQPGSLAVQVRDQPGFVNIRAGADLSFIRFQPAGWWAGFTERCIVAELTSAGAKVSVPKTACVRVLAPGT